MNLVPSGAISGVDGGALIGPRSPSPEKSFMLSNRTGLLRRGGAEAACVGCRLSLSSTTWAFTSMVGGSSLANGVWASLRVLDELALKHALQERCGLAQLACTREPGCFANCGLIQQRFTSSCLRVRGSGMQGPQHRDRGVGGAGQLGSDVLGDGGDLQHLAGSPRRFEILAAVLSQPEVQTLSGRRLLDPVSALRQLRPAFSTITRGRFRMFFGQRPVLWRSYKRSSRTALLQILWLSS